MLTRCGFLFLGYGLRDWNLRAILQQIWGQQKFKYHSWAIQLSPEPLDQKFWSQRDVEIIDASLEDYMVLLADGIKDEPGQRQDANAV
jgi:hypothetical protein